MNLYNIVWFMNGFVISHHLGLAARKLRAFHQSLTFDLNQCLAPIALNQGPDT